jgi:putative transcriptional regulator
MSINHHPPEAMLAAFAAGTLDHGQHIAIATHLVSCQQCRRFRRAMEEVGGAVVEGLEPAVMSSGALEKVVSQLSRSNPTTAKVAPVTVPEAEIPGLPTFLRRYSFGGWRWVAPSVHVRPIVLPHASDTRVFLLKAGPGTKMLQHAHTGLELTCVLSGAFRQEGAHFGPGDFDFGDDTIDHWPLVEPGEDCICLVAMQGDLELKGLLGRIVQPFVRL